jgi:hypothetical protein
MLLNETSCCLLSHSIFLFVILRKASKVTLHLLNTIFLTFITIIYNISCRLNKYLIIHSEAFAENKCKLIQLIVVNNQIRDNFFTKAYSH